MWIDCETYLEGPLARNVLFENNTKVIGVIIITEYDYELEPDINIKFKTIPQTKAISIEHKGPYSKLRDVYAFAMNYIKENDLEVHVTNKKSPDGDDWNLIDIGPIVVHLMSDAAREFYDLEKLWHAGKIIEFSQN